MATTNTYKRVSKQITDNKDIDYLLSLTPADITQETIMELFGDFGGKRRFNTYDIITIPTWKIGYIVNGKKVTNSNPFTTTIGRWIFNIFFIFDDPGIASVIGYVNEDLTKKVYNKIYSSLTYAVLENRITIESYKAYLFKYQFFMQFVSILSPSWSDNIITIADKIEPEKEKLVKANIDKINNGDIFTTDEISNELLNKSREILKDDPAMDLFNSGIGSFDNNFKNIFVMRGSVKDPDPTKGYNAITGNFINGIPKTEYSKLANSLSAGPYARAKKTELGGYWEKLFTYAFGHVKLLPEGSDCGTKRTLSVFLTDTMADLMMYSYIVDNGKLVQLNSQNKNNYIGKNVKFRFSAMCESREGICNKCAGDLVYKLGITNIGLLTQQIPSVLKVNSMKQFHDDQVTFVDLGNDIDPMKVFGLE